MNNMKESDLLALSLGDIDNNSDNDNDDNENINNLIPIKSKNKWFTISSSFQKKNKINISYDNNSINDNKVKSRYNNTNTTYNEDSNNNTIKKKKRKKDCYKKLSLKFRKALASFCLTCYDSNRLGSAYHEIPILWPIIDWIRGIRLVLFGVKSHKSGLLVSLLGLILSMILEIFPNTGKINMITIVTLMASLEIWYFPSNTMRPQLVLCLVLAVTLFIDIFHILGQLAGYHHITPIHIVTFIIMITKLMTLQIFLYQVRGSLKARKYLMRRLRLFLVPLSKPRRMMREIRSRILATEIIQIISIVGFLLLFILSLTVFDYSYHFLGSWYGWYLWQFLIVKSSASLLVLLPLLYDTDIVLLLSYFGCINFFGEYVKKYINDKKNELGGWPYPYYYNELRYQLVCFIKLLDFLWSIMGWLIIGRSLAPYNFFAMEDSFRVYVCLILLFLFVADLWGIIIYHYV